MCPDHIRPYGTYAKYKDRIRPPRVARVEVARQSAIARPRARVRRFAFDPPRGVPSPAPRRVPDTARTARAARTPRSPRARSRRTRGTPPPPLALARSREHAGGRDDAAVGHAYKLVHTRQHGAQA